MMRGSLKEKDMYDRKECIIQCLITGFLTMALVIGSIILIAYTDISAATTEVAGHDTVLTVITKDTGARTAELEDQSIQDIYLPQV